MVPLSSAIFTKFTFRKYPEKIKYIPATEGQRYHASPGQVWLLLIKNNRADFVQLSFY